MYGDPGLKPEHGISNDFGIEYSHNKVRRLTWSAIILTVKIW